MAARNPKNWKVCLIYVLAKSKLPGFFGELPLWLKATNESVFKIHVYVKSGFSQADPRLEELQEELAQLEQKQLEHRRAITSMKASILNNDQTIQQMLIQAVETS